MGRYNKKNLDIIAHILDKSIHPRIDYDGIVALCNLKVDGQYNVYGGNSAFYSKTTGDHNVFLGDSAAYSGTEYSYNVGIGNAALWNNIIGNYNTFIGNSAGYGILLGNNIGVGNASLYSGSAVQKATAVGDSAGYSLVTSIGGLYLGYSAGYNVTDDSGNPNVIIGFQAGSYLTGASYGNVILGANAGPGCLSEAKVNQGWIDNRQTDRSLLKMDFGDANNDNDPRILRVHGDLVVVGNLITYENDVRKFAKLVMHMNDDFSDSSPSNHTPTITNPEIDYVIKYLGGGSGHFVEGDSDYVSFAKHADFEPGTVDWTLEGWFYLDSFHTDYGAGNCDYVSLVRYGENTSVNYWNLMVSRSATAKFCIWFTAVSTAGSGTILIDCAFEINSNIIGEWHHILVARHCSEIYMFFDGVKQTIVASMADYPTYDRTYPTYDLSMPEVGPLYIGKAFALAHWNYFDGHVDEVRFSKGIAWHSEDFLVQLKEFGE